MMRPPVLVLNQNTEREVGRKAQLGNIVAAKAVSDIVRTTLGPRSMLKMLLDPMGGIVITNDGNAILREVDVSHPGAKSMIELSRAQDEEVGDGTTSVIILAGEMLVVAEPLLQRKMHPTQIVGGYYKAMEAALKICDDMAVSIDVEDTDAMRRLIGSAIGTKFSSRYGMRLCDMAVDAVRRVAIRETGSEVDVDIKRYAKVEKIPGGDLDDCAVLSGVMFNKDVTHSRMRRRIENPRIMLLDCTLEYKKGESKTDVEVTKEEDWDKLLKQEEAEIQRMCGDIIRFSPDVVITEKGVSDLAQHYLVKAGITAIRRLRKTDNNRVARCVGATIVHRTDEITEEDIGTGCGLFEVRKIGDEYFTFIEECAEPKACTILLRGASKDALNEMERNLQDAMQVARNVVLDPRLLPGGGATEMAVAAGVVRASKGIEGIQQWPFRAVGQAMEVIPRTLAQNCGADTVRLLTALRAKHVEGGSYWGLNGVSGELQDMKVSETAIWEPHQVKVQTIKTAIESAALLLRIDDIVSGMSRKG